jgi:hypothetical protein
MKGIVAILTILSIYLAQAPQARAFETDQYNLPPVPLADIGDEVAEYTADKIREALSKVNREIEELSKVGSSGKADAKNAARLAFLRSEDAVAREVFKRLGSGFIAFAKAGTWMDSHDFRAQPARYKTGYRRSIYALLPANYLTISPTVNLYGTSLGTDKIAHFFQQGYTYHRIYKRALEKGLSERDARTKALRWGRMTEHTYYGTLVGGVFSNADLAANFAGMRFYEGLTKPILIDGAVRPPLLELRDGMWRMNGAADIGRDLLKPFISDHLNEALNPSVLAPGLRSFVRGVVRKQSCPKWIALYPGRTKGDFEKVTSELRLWNGEDYGFRDSEKFVTIANTCLGSTPSEPQR